MSELNKVQDHAGFCRIIASSFQVEDPGGGESRRFFKARFSFASSSRGLFSFISFFPVQNRGQFTSAGERYGRRRKITSTHQHRVFYLVVFAQSTIHNPESQHGRPKPSLPLLFWAGGRFDTAATSDRRSHISETLWFVLARGSQQGCATKTSPRTPVNPLPNHPICSWQAASDPPSREGKGKRHDLPAHHPRSVDRMNATVTLHPNQSSSINHQTRNLPFFSLPPPQGSDVSVLSGLRHACKTYYICNEGPNEGPNEGLPKGCRLSGVARRLYINVPFIGVGLQRDWLIGACRKNQDPGPVPTRASLVPGLDAIATPEQAPSRMHVTPTPQHHHHHPPSCWSMAFLFAVAKYVQLC